MDIGLFNTNAGPCSWPDGAQRIAQLAEELGYESLWMGEHVVAPSPRVTPSPIEPTARLLDPLVALSFLAGVTQRVRLATGIIILPQRNPLVLAKQVASLDVLSRGRLVLGLGVGYLEPEFRALGVPLADRGARSDEYLEAMRRLWADEAPVFAGRYVSYAGIDAHPRPVDPAGPPVVIGGNSPVAYRRAVAHGNGWYGFALTPEATEASLAGLHRAAEQVERPNRLGSLSITVTPRGRVDRAAAARFSELGVDRLVILPPGGDDVESWADFVAEHAPAELVG
ncbi:MAG: LLM class F420-dependent oxidoreductase [Acidimicrobiales bacterium]|jgi:probable F420-dependent oxidoreductase